MVNVYHWRAMFTIGGESYPGLVQATRLTYVETQTITGVSDIVTHSSGLYNQLMLRARVGFKISLVQLTTHPPFRMMDFNKPV